MTQQPSHSLDSVIPRVCHVGSKVREGGEQRERPALNNEWIFSIFTVACGSGQKEQSEPRALLVPTISFQSKSDRISRVFWEVKPRHILGVKENRHRGRPDGWMRKPLPGPPIGNQGAAVRKRIWGLSIGKVDATAT